MALVVKDRVRETSTSTGTGTITLNGAVSGFQSFSVIGNANTTYYTIVDAATGAWEVGIGTYTASGTLLSRDTILESSTGGTAVNFVAGAKDVFVTYPAEKAVYVDGSTITPATAATLPVVSGGTGITSLGAGVATFLGTPSSANLAAAVTDETGTGSLVFATSPTLVTPALGTPSALVGTNITGTAAGLTAGNVTTNANLTGAVTSVGNATSLGSFSSANLAGALTDETGSGFAVFATSPTLVTPALGTPSSATLTNATGLPISTGVSGLGTNVATFLATPSSANLAAAVTDETGSGALVFATSPTLVTPALGTPASGVVTNLTGTASININGTVGATTANTGSFTTLEASSPASFAAGTALLPAITRTGDTNTGMWFPAADTIAFSEGGVEAMRITSDGNVGIGTSSPGYKLTIQGASFVGSSFNGIGIQDTDAERIRFGYNDGTPQTGLVAAQISANASVMQIVSRDVSNGALSFHTGSGVSERMRIDSSGNVGIGTSSPGSRLEVVDTNSIVVSRGTAGFGSFYAQSSGTNPSYLFMGNAGGEKTRFSSLDDGTITIGNTTSNTERMRIDASGNLLVGTTTQGSVNATSFSFSPNATGGADFSHINGTSSGVMYCRFNYNGTDIGSITQNGTTGVLYNLTSDYRLKNDPQPLTGSKDFIMALQPKKWQWWDGSGEGVGFIAHEFMEVAKHSGNGEKDAVDADGKPVYQSIQPSSSEVMANLIALVQEQQALIQDLTTRLTTLEGN